MANTTDDPADNTLLTIGAISAYALDTLYEQTIMARLVTRDYDGDFRGGVGDTVTIRKPATFTAEVFNRANGITVQDINESSTDVKLDTLLDVSFAVTAEQMALDIWSFGSQVMAPAIEAIAQKIDADLLALAVGTGVTQSVNVNAAASGAPDPVLLLGAVQKLNEAKVAQSPRYGVVTPSMAAGFLADELFSEYSARGDTIGLREASIDRKFGVDWFQTANLTGKYGVAFHPSAFALVTRTLPPPMGAGAGQSSVVQRDGFGIRVVRSYDINLKQDVISVDTLVGYKLLDAARACRLYEQ